MNLEKENNMLVLQVKTLKEHADKLNNDLSVISNEKEKIGRDFEQVRRELDVLLYKTDELNTEVEMRNKFIVELLGGSYE